MKASALLQETQQARAGPTKAGWFAIGVTVVLLAIASANDPEHVAAYAAVAGTLAVAVVTWIATDRRLSRELAHQHRRDEISDLRSFFDSVARDYERARDAILTLAQSQQPGGAEAVRPRYQAMQAQVFPLYSSYRRLQVRVAQTERVVEAFDAVREHVFDAMVRLKVKQLPLTGEAQADINNSLEKGHVEFRTFVTEARDYLRRLAQQ